MKVWELLFDLDKYDMFEDYFKNLNIFGDDLIIFRSFTLSLFDDFRKKCYLSFKIM